VPAHDAQLAHQKGLFGMKPLRIFISSVQKEFSTERIALRDWLRNDALMHRFFEPFLFEDVPAADRRADEVYLDEVAGCGHDTLRECAVCGNDRIAPPPANGCLRQ